MESTSQSKSTPFNLCDPQRLANGYSTLTQLSIFMDLEPFFNGNSRILKWSYCTIFQAIFCWDIPGNIGLTNRPYISLYMVGTLFIMLPLGWSTKNSTGVFHVRTSPLGHDIYIYIWVNYNNSLTWIKPIWGWFPILTMIPSEVVVRSL